MNKTLNNFQVPNVVFYKINNINKIHFEKKTSYKCNMFTYLQPYTMEYYITLSNVNIVCIRAI